MLDGWGEAITELERSFLADSRARADKVAMFLAAYVGHVERHPELLQLDALSHGVLERNLEAETLLDFKRTLLARMSTGATVLEQALGLAKGRGLPLLTHTHAMTRGLWQSFDHAPAAPGPLSPPRSGFGTELTEALTEYWRGALAGSNPGADAASTTGMLS